MTWPECLLIFGLAFLVVLFILLVGVISSLQEELRSISNELHVLNFKNANERRFFKK